jgi:Proto-chlorophyllide reductase 57 kD subunit
MTEPGGARPGVGDPAGNPAGTAGCPAEELCAAPEPAPGEVRWTPEAEMRLRRAPLFLRGMVRRLAEKRARAEGIAVITPELMTRYKDQMMGMAGRGTGDTPPAPVPWTPEALTLLADVPEFMRPITRRICEELAAERGASHVGPTLILEAEAEAEVGEEPLAWTSAAETALLARLERTPVMMADFVLRLVKRDVEIEARRAGERVVTPERVQQALAPAGEELVRWAPEAWARLQTAPEFVRTGIQKAAERRARRSGLEEITSPVLTRFRNEAMMKAVRRIRELGFTELTFEAFDAAAVRIRTVALNPEAQVRLDTIRRYFATERTGASGDLLGPDLMRRFRDHLRDPAGTPLDSSGLDRAGEEPGA